MYALALEIAGLRVLAVANAIDAVAAALSWAPDIVVTDFLLRSPITGADLCRQLHDEPRTRHIPTLVVTGSSRKSEVEAILGAGCAEIRLKPYLPDQMIYDVRRLLGRSTARRSA